MSANWPYIRSLVLADQSRCATIPQASCAKVNIATANSSGTNLVSAALSLPEGRIYGTPHSIDTSRVLDVHTMQMTVQTPSIGVGVARSNGSVLFPDGEIMPVPGHSSSCWVLDPKTETGRIISSSFPANYAYLGGAPWVDGESALLAPHSARHARLINKNTGAIADLTGYTFTGQYACAGVRRVGATGEYLFVPHSHNKFVLLNPDTMTFRELPFLNAYADGYLGATNINDGRIVCAAHWAPSHVVIDVVNETLQNIPAPVGGAALGSQANFRGPIRLVDGRVLFIPFKHSKAWVWDPATNTTTQCPGTYTSGDVACGALASDGSAYLMPWNGGVTYKLSTGYGFPVAPEVFCSPWFNGL